MSAAREPIQFLAVEQDGARRHAGRPMTRAAREAKRLDREKRKP